MRNLKVKKWWKAAGVRAIKTVAQTAVATIGTAAVLSAVDWRTALSASVLAGCYLSSPASPDFRKSTQKIKINNFFTLRRRNRKENTNVK